MTNPSFPPRLAAAVVAVCAGAAVAAQPPAVEVQINLCGTAAQVRTALQLPASPRARLAVWYFDTPALDLFAHGAVVRLRRQAERATLTVKLADVDCRAPAVADLARRGGKCEVDQHGADAKAALSLERTLDAGAVRALLAQPAALGEHLGATQQAGLLMIAGTGPWPAVRALGPAQIESFRDRASGADVEFWQLPDGRRYAEMSRKVAAARAPSERAALFARLDAAGVAPCADQSSQAGAKLRALTQAP